MAVMLALVLLGASAEASLVPAHRDDLAAALDVGAAAETGVVAGDVHVDGDVHGGLGMNVGQVTPKRRTQ